jgi:hypothetical protein
MGEELLVMDLLDAKGRGDPAAIIHVIVAQASSGVNASHLSGAAFRA